MTTFIRIRTPDELSRIEGLSALPPFNPEDVICHSPDAHWILLNVDGRPTGRYSLWWRKSPPCAGHRPGLIGHYAVRDGSDAHQLLRHACAELVKVKCTLAIGPMDGNTWHRYRFITERGSEPPFYLEPDNPDDWPEHFAEFGFTSLAGFISRLNSDLTYEDPRAKRAEERLAAIGIRIRPLDLRCFDEELRRIYTVAELGFRNNFLYTPLSETEFIAQYRYLEPHVRPELVLIAELAKRPIGFIFAIPDLLQARCGQPINTAIIKSVAVLPERAYAGLGAYLVARCQTAARELGYKRIIHALMHESNISRNISGRFTQPMRRYTLFASLL